MVIEPIHTAIPGRARFKIGGLKGSARMKHALELRLAGEADIDSASANPVTGSLLIRYRSSLQPGTVARRLEGLVLAARDLARSLPPASDHIGPKPHAIVPRMLTPEATGKPLLGAWHTRAARSVAAAARSDTIAGLSQSEADQRIKEQGLNEIPKPESRSQAGIFLSQLNSLPVFLLGAAAGISVLVGGLSDAVIIGGVVIANSLIGYMTESRAEKTIESLHGLVHPTAEVVRDGASRIVPAEKLVRGDLLVLKRGMYVGADARVTAADRLSVNESMLTGESLPVYKQVRVLRGKRAPLAARTNMVYQGTFVTGGQGNAVVVATGRDTEAGRLQLLLSETASPRTPIQAQLDRMGNQLALGCLAICGVVFGIGVVRGYGLLQMLKTAISLAASAIPEGLPVAATINFAWGIGDLRARGVLVRRLPAVETLGAVQTVCLDKTGTITGNRMTVHAVEAGERSFTVGEDGRTLGAVGKDNPTTIEEVRRLLTACAVCNDLKVRRTKDSQIEVLGSSTEKALMGLALGAMPDAAEARRSYPVIGLHLRSEKESFMRSLHACPTEDSRYVFAKGSPGSILDLCDRRMVDGHISRLTDAVRRRLKRRNERLAERGLRVLGFGFNRLPGAGRIDENAPLVWLGLVGLADPVRSGVPEFIHAFHQAGIETVMLTGDQRTTALAVARELNIGGSSRVKVVDSADMPSGPPATDVDVYSRVSPARKLRIVQALQATGRVVAMTGDGVNDGPALKAADLGIAMGESGTDAAREAADIVISDDDLGRLIEALRGGRRTYANIRKSVRFFLATNLTEVTLVLVSSALGLGFPLTVRQLLWINIITDIFPGLALSREPPEEDFMRQPPRPAGAPLFSGRDYAAMAMDGAVISAGALAVYGYGLARYGTGARASSPAFQALVFGQLLHAYNCRSETRRNRDLPDNPYVRWSVGLSIGLQLIVPLLPFFRGFLGLVRPSLPDAIIAAAGGLLPYFLNAARKPLQVQ